MAENDIPYNMATIEDDRPLAVRRKRRISTSVTDPVHVPTAQKTEDDVDHLTPPSKTPTKPKKRVRFSDPGPETSTASDSTGLTPYFKRTSFTPLLRGSALSKPQLLAGAPRRLSLPIQLSTSLPSPSLSPLPATFSGEVQFEPFRQILDARLKRRLRRNKLSEEMNDIDEETKSMSKWRQEIQGLKHELALAKESGSEEHSEGLGGGTASADRIRELEQQLSDLRQEMQERSTTAEPVATTTEENIPLTPEMDIFVDNPDEDFLAPGLNGTGDPREAGPIGGSVSVSEAITQASLPSYTDTFREARLSLEYLFPGEITLGLIPEDPKPLLDIMLDRMRGLKAQILFAEDTISTTKKQESNLRNQFNAVLEQLDRARKYAETISTRNSNEKARADSTQSRVEMLESTVQAAASKFEELEKDADEKDQTIQKLQNALGTYRVEVGKLESLITRLEGEHSAAMLKVRAEMDEAVADLECHVVAETRGRREAEQEVEQREATIKQLRRQEQELKSAVNEKQQIIRETERIFEEERIGREREVGGLNVHIGLLSSDLSDSNEKVAKAEEKQVVLMRKLQEERDAGLQAVEAVQAELAQCAERAEDVKTAHVSDVRRRGAEVTQNQGLLTPVSVCRFKDVEGYVEVRRGKGKSKKRPDSGIVILEDEDTIMADDL